MGQKYFSLSETISANQFMKILVACGATLEQITDWRWEIELGDKPQSYHCIGCHPVAKRLDLYGTDIFIH
ncbi:MAG: hypothetical protein WC979_03385 [Candidatus Pacearchaeota archaeon]|jgi:hypothetical protein|nr:hypothetical protein [Clostridia bacterium]